MRRWFGGKMLLVAVATGAAAAWAAHDYTKWRALGPGGLPSNLLGWLKMTRYRWMAHDELDVRSLAVLAGASGDLFPSVQIERRPGPRPAVSPYPIPHRQIDQLPEMGVRVALTTLFDNTVSSHRDQVKFARSHFEKRHPAVTLRTSTGTMGAASFGEIAHIHPSDSSMHMVLSPGDAVAAIRLGWARRHGLAGRAVGLPATYVMVYAPRDTQDLAVVAKLLDAAIRYAVQPICNHESSSGPSKAGV